MWGLRQHSLLGIIVGLCGVSGNKLYWVLLLGLCGASGNTLDCALLFGLRGPRAHYWVLLLVYVGPLAFVFSFDPSISIFITGKPYLQRPLFQTNIEKTINFFICIIVCSNTVNKNFGNESYFQSSYGNFNYRGESSNATPNKDW
jgi:hypothetical protein